MDSDLSFKLTLGSSPLYQRRALTPTMDEDEAIYEELITQNDPENVNKAEDRLSSLTNEELANQYKRLFIGPLSESLLEENPPSFSPLPKKDNQSKYEI